LKRGKLLHIDANGGAVCHVLRLHIIDNLRVLQLLSKVFIQNVTCNVI
jgi:hypothetical protein